MLETRMMLSELNDYISSDVIPKSVEYNSVSVHMLHNSHFKTLKNVIKTFPEDLMLYIEENDIYRDENMCRLQLRVTNSDDIYVCVYVIFLPVLNRVQLYFNFRKVETEREVGYNYKLLEALKDIRNNLLIENKETIIIKKDSGVYHLSLDYYDFDLSIE